MLSRAWCSFFSELARVMSHATMEYVNIEVCIVFYGGYIHVFSIGFEFVPM